MLLAGLLTYSRFERLPDFIKSVAKVIVQHVFVEISKLTCSLVYLFTATRVYSYGYSLGFAPNSLFIVHSEANGMSDTKIFDAKVEIISCGKK